MKAFSGKDPLCCYQNLLTALDSLFRGLVSTHRPGERHSNTVEEMYDAHWATKHRRERTYSSSSGGSSSCVSGVSGVGLREEGLDL